MGLIFYFSTLTGAEASQSLESGAIAWLGELRSYAGHIVLYAVLAALIQASIWGWNLGVHVRWVIIAALLSSLFGITDEYHQSFVIGRSATVMDGLVDSVAATASAALLWFLATRIAMGRRSLPGTSRTSNPGTEEPPPWHRIHSPRRIGLVTDRRLQPRGNLPQSRSINTIDADRS